MFDGGNAEFRISTNLIRIRAEKGVVRMTGLSLKVQSEHNNSLNTLSNF